MLAWLFRGPWTELETRLSTTVVVASTNRVIIF